MAGAACCYISLSNWAPAFAGEEKGGFARASLGQI